MINPIKNNIIVLHHRQMSTHLTFPDLQGIWDIDMPSAREETPSLTSTNSSEVRESRRFFQRA